MCEEFAPSFLVTIMLGRSAFGNCFGHIEDAASDNIQDIIFLGGGLMLNDADLFGGRTKLKILARDWYDMWKYLESKSTVMFSVTLMCWEYRYTSLLKRVQPSHRATVSWTTSFTGSNDALCIHPRALEISVKARMWDHCPSCYMDTLLLLRVQTIHRATVS